MNIGLLIENPALLLQVLIIGLSNGAILALIALGYTMVYGIIELINFAHGDVFMLGAMTALTLIQVLALAPGLPASTLVPLLLLVLVGTMATTATLNVLIERLAYRPLRRAPRLAPLITAIGMSFILMNIGLHWKGPSYVTFPPLIPSIDLLNEVLGLRTVVSLRTTDLFVVALTVPLLLGLNWFVRHTRLGKAMRATAQNQEAAALMGIDINQTIALTFLIAGALAGAGGFIQGLYYQSARFDMGFRAGLMAFTSAVLGGIGNLTGAVLGGFLIGLIWALSDFLFDPKWTLVVVFGILVLIIVFRPSGLLGAEVPERA
jgi:branched-chain amino acid transport system permease protein